MALNQSYPIYNGIAPSWSDFRITAKGSDSPLIEMSDIKSIDTGVTLEVGEVQGASGGKVIRTTTGSSKHEAKWVLYHAGYTSLMRALGPTMVTRGDKRVWGTVFLDIQGFWTPPNSDELFEVRINGCRLLGRAINAAFGTDATEVEMALHPSEIVDVIDGIEYVVL